MLQRKKFVRAAVFGLIVVMLLAACSTPAPAVPAAAKATTAPAAPAQPAAKEATKAAPAAAPATAAPAAAKVEPKKGGTLIVGQSGEPTALDVLSGSLATTRITALICENLVGEDTTAVGQVSTPIIPKLAEKWDISADGLTYTFSLRKGVKFTDGTPFDAEAVKANFDRVLAKDSPLYDAKGQTAVASRTKWIASYRVVDPSTFEVKLKEPYASFIRGLKHRNFGIISPTALKDWSTKMSGEHLVCTGPFKHVEREQGVKVVLERNADYWDKAKVPYLDKVIFRTMPDVGARLAALQTGEIDIEMEVPADRVKGLSTDPNVTVVMPGHPHVYYMFLNHKTPALTNPKVRQALWHAIDNEGMIKSLYGDTAVPVQGFLPPGNPAYRADYKRPYPYDPAKAKQLLAEAGFATGLKINYVFPMSGASYMDSPAIAQWIQSNWKAVGVEAVLQPYEWAAWSAMLAPGLVDNRDVAVNGIQSIADDPFFMDQYLAGYNQRPAGSNMGFYSNAEVDKLFGEARRESDPAKSIKLYQQAEEMLLKDVAVIPLAHDKQPRAFNKRLQGLAFGPSAWFELNSVWVK